MGVAGRAAPAWDRRLVHEHYLGRSFLIGGALCTVAVVDGESVTGSLV